MFETVKQSVVGQVLDLGEAVIQIQEVLASHKQELESVNTALLQRQAPQGTDSPIVTRSIKVVRKSALKTRIDEDPENVAALQDLQHDVAHDKKKIVELEAQLQFLTEMAEKTV